MSSSQVPGGAGISWHLRKILDLADRISRAYYSRKHRAWAKEMGRDPDPAPDSRGRGFIVIQIDAVSEELLREAIDKGYAPFLGSLLASREAQLARWQSGQPSTTPAVQAGIMYGNNFDIPAFRWYEKERHASVVCKSPPFMAALQRRISEGHPGILTGGSSYVNMFDGDATLSLLTLGAIGRHRFFENVRGMSFLLLLALSPISVLRILGRAVWEYLDSAWQHFKGIFSRRTEPDHTQPSAFSRVADDVLFREIQTFAAMLDVYRGVPSIYTNFNSYDEVAHHFGTDSTRALRTLRGIDRQIARIDRMRRLYNRRQYDLYVLSDHGMTPSVPFKQVYGETLGEWIRDQAGEPILLDEMASGEELATVRTQLLLDELAMMAERVGPRQRAIVRSARRFLGKQLPERLDASDWDLEHTSDIVVRNSGSAAHVYFNVAPRPLQLSEIALIYPELLQRLVDHPGIGLVVAREGASTVIMGRRGRATVSVMGIEVDGENPLLIADEPDVAAEQLHYLDSFPHSGDLIVFGGWHAPGVLIAFEDQIATHGGLGGPQTYAFVLYPTQYDIDTQHITNSTQMYDYFAERYLHRQDGHEEYMADRTEDRSTVSGPLPADARS